MSLIEIHPNQLQRRLEITGHINERDILFNPTEIVLNIKRELVSTIVDHLMEKLTPNLDQAILQAFNKKEND